MFAGSRQFQVPAAAQRPALSAFVHYPCERASAATPFGPYELDVSVDAPLAPGRFALVLVSHGSGGAPLLYRSVSLLLARSGYIVALLKHPGNSLGDNALADSPQNLRSRPRHLVALLDALLADPQLGGSISEAPVTVIGHSMGGFTALSLAGGQPWTRSGQRIDVVQDPRIGALVLLAPACGWFLAPGALRHVTARILALTAEHDDLTPDREVRTALAGVPNQAAVTIETIPNAGHFSFLAPFPRAMRNPGFAPALDLAGFDRERFHRQFPQRVLDWLGGA